MMFNALTRCTRWVVAGALLTTPTICSAQPFTLIRRDLSRQIIHGPLFSDDALGEDQIHYDDAQGHPISLPSDSLLALFALEPRLRPPPEGSLGEDPVGELRTVDGRVLYGRPVATSGDDTIGWETLLRDRLTLALDQVRSISMRANDSIDPPNAAGDEEHEDKVLLINGDELTGFVLAYRPLVEIETSTGVRTFEPQRVRGVILANPSRQSEHTLVALADGSVLACDSIASTQEGSVVLTDADTHSQLEVVLDDLVGVLWHPDTVVGLAALGKPTQTPGDALRWIEPVASSNSPPLGLGDVSFSGPMLASWPLPEGAQRFSSGVELPESTLPWGACEVAVLVQSPGHPEGRVELDKVSLDPEHPRGELLADLSSTPANAHLFIEVRAGRRGPVEDRPILRAPFIQLSGP